LILHILILRSEIFYVFYVCTQFDITAVITKKL